MRSVDPCIMDFRFPWMAFLGGVRLGQNFPWKRKIHGKSVSTSVFLGEFFLECGFIFHGKTKIHGKEIHSKIPRIYRTHPKTKIFIFLKDDN